MTSCRIGEAIDGHGGLLTKGGRSARSPRFEIAIRNLKDAVFGAEGDDEAHWMSEEGFQRDVANRRAAHLPDDLALEQGALVRGRASVSSGE